MNASGAPLGVPPVSPDNSPAIRAGSAGSHQPGPLPVFREAVRFASRNIERLTAPIRERSQRVRRLENLSDVAAFLAETEFGDTAVR